MAHTVVALYDDFDTARRVVEELVSSSFKREEISIVANDASGTIGTSVQGVTVSDKDDVKAGEGAGFGAVVGTVIGLGVALIPGIGPVVAAGPLAAALMAGIGAAAGAATGGVAASLIDFGMSEEEAGYYHEGIRGGGTLVTVNLDSDTHVGRAQDIMNRYNPVNVEDRFANTGSISTQDTTRSQSNLRSGVQASLPVAGEDLLVGNRSAAQNSVRSYTQTAGGSMAGMTYRPYTDYETSFRTHYDTNYAKDGYTYDQYVPAYRYGYTLATTDRYRDYDWSRIEPEARTYWEERNPSSWERFKDSIRESWQQVSGRR